MKTKLKNCFSKIDVLRLSVFIFIILTISSWIFVFKVEGASISNFFSPKNIFYGKKFIKELIGIGEEIPAFMDSERIKNALKLTYDTLQMSIMAIGFSTLGMILTVIPASRNDINDSFSNSKKWYRRILFSFIRLLYLFSRAIPELIWAMIVVFIFNPGILPGAIALALHNFGILGKLCAEVIEDIDLRPIRNLASSGGNNKQILLYGFIPTVMPKFITYILYRWEVIIRTTIVVGLVGAGGLGQQFKLSMSWFHYTDITLLLLCYFILVGLVDILSQGIRKLIR